MPMKIGNTEYVASEFTDQDYSDIVGYARKKYLEYASSSDNERLLSVALKEAAGFEWGDDTVTELISTVEGTLRLGFQFCRKRHPNLQFTTFEREARTNLRESLHSILLTYSAFNNLEVPTEDVVGGTSTEKEKSPS